MKTKILFSVLTTLLFLNTAEVMAQNEKESNTPDKLVIV
jgi:hypothetical protein